jgi:hypothetical protein
MKEIIGGIIALGALGLTVSFMIACAVFPVLVVVWLIKEIWG